jgi:hypothetical protein
MATPRIAATYLVLKPDVLLEGATYVLSFDHAWTVPRPRVGTNGSCLTDALHTLNLYPPTLNLHPGPHPLRSYWRLIGRLVAAPRQCFR